MSLAGGSPELQTKRLAAARMGLESREAGWTRGAREKRERLECDENRATKASGMAAWVTQSFNKKQ